MSPSSIFSSDTLQAPVMQIVTRPAAVLTLALLVGIEQGLRLLVPPGHIPTGSWHNAELRDQARQLEAMSEVDLMITGSSVAAVNLRPTVMDAALEKHGLRINSFNAGIRGCDYSCIGPLFQQLFVSRNKPDYAMLVVAPRDLNEANAFAMERSQGFLKTFGMKEYAANLVDVFSYAWIFGFRKEIRQYISTREWLYDKSKIPEQGHVQLGDKKLRRHNFQLKVDAHGRMASALYALTDSLLAQDIDVVVLPGLFDSETRLRIDTESWRNYSEVLSRLAGNDHVTLLDANHLIPADDQFIDRDHLSNTASAAYSEVIARYLYELGFPWKPTAAAGQPSADD